MFPIVPSLIGGHGLAARFVAASFIELFSSRIGLVWTSDPVLQIFRTSDIREIFHEHADMHPHRFRVDTLPQNSPPGPATIGISRLRQGQPRQRPVMPVK